MSEPRQETTAENEISKLGIEVFLPTYIRAIRHSGKTKRERRMLFPPYFFVSFTWDHPAWQMIFSRRGVAGMITNSYNRPMIVPNAQMAHVRTEAEKYEDVICDDIPFAEGDVVKIITGLLAGKDAVIESLKNAARPKVLVGNLPVDVPREYLAPVA